MKWEDYHPNSFPQSDYTKTDIECPECGEFVYRYDKAVLTTYPPMHRYDCLVCGWSGVK